MIITVEAPVKLYHSSGDAEEAHLHLHPHPDPTLVLLEILQFGHGARWEFPITLLTRRSTRAVHAKPFGVAVWTQRPHTVIRLTGDSGNPLEPTASVDVVVEDQVVAQFLRCWTAQWN